MCGSWVFLGDTLFNTTNAPLPTPEGQSCPKLGPPFFWVLRQPFLRADPGPRNALLAKHLSGKASLCAIQLVLGLCGTVLLFYVPIAVVCEESGAIAFVTVRARMIPFFAGGGN